MTTTPINQERILVDTEMPTSTNSFEDVYDFESFLQEGKKNNKKTQKIQKTQNLHLQFSSFEFQ